MTYSLTDTDIAIAPRSPDVQRDQAIESNGATPPSVGGVVRAVAPYLTADLISPAHLAYLQSIAGQLPRTLTNYFGFECRLGQAAPLADILFCVRQVGRQPAVLGGLLPGIPEKWARQELVWQQLRDFGRQWASPTSLLFRKVQDVWLEFDASDLSDLSDLPIPSLFFGSKVIHNGFPTEAHRWISRDAVRLLTGQSLSKPLEGALLNCIAALPDKALLFQMGAMLSREPVFVRVCVSRLTPETLPPYLEAVGWTGERSRLTSLLDELTPFTGNIALDLDLLEGEIGPKIGLECGLQKDGNAAEWTPFLDYLVARQLCLPGKRDGVLHYLAAANGADEIECGLHHVKVVLQEGKPLQAKAYLSVVTEAI